MLLLGGRGERVRVREKDLDARESVEDLLLLGGPGKREGVREKELNARECVEESEWEAALEGNVPRDNEAMGVGVREAVPEPVGLGVGV